MNVHVNPIQLNPLPIGVVWAKNPNKDSQIALLAKRILRALTYPLRSFLPQSFILKIQPRYKIAIQKQFPEISLLINKYGSFQNIQRRIEEGAPIEEFLTPFKDKSISEKVLIRDIEERIALKKVEIYLKEIQRIADKFHEVWLEHHIFGDGLEVENIALFKNPKKVIEEFLAFRKDTIPKDFGEWTKMEVDYFAYNYFGKIFAFEKVDTILFQLKNLPPIYLNFVQAAESTPKTYKAIGMGSILERKWEIMDVLKNLDQDNSSKELTLDYWLLKDVEKDPRLPKEKQPAIEEWKKRFLADFLQRVKNHNAGDFSKKITSKEFKIMEDLGCHLSEEQKAVLEQWLEQFFFSSNEPFQICFYKSQEKVHFLSRLVNYIFKQFFYRYEHCNFLMQKDEEIRKIGIWNEGIYNEETSGSFSKTREQYAINIQALMPNQLKEEEKGIFSSSFQQKLESIFRQHQKYKVSYPEPLTPKSFIYRFLRPNAFWTIDPEEVLLETSGPHRECFCSQFVALALVDATKTAYEATGRKLTSMRPLGFHQGENLDAMHPMKLRNKLLKKKIIRLIPNTRLQVLEESPR